MMVDAIRSDYGPSLPYGTVYVPFPHRTGRAMVIRMYSVRVPCLLK